MIKRPQAEIFKAEWRPENLNPQRRGRKKIARASTYLGVRRTQPELDFVDVDVYGDVPLFVNPGAIRRSESDWAQHCAFLIRDFMQLVVESIRSNELDHARNLLMYLGEPNETHLGLSAVGQPARGHAVGEEFAELIIDAIRNSPAGKSGRITDLEDTVMMIAGIGSDLISDITTNIIRGPLIQYTNDICGAYGVDMGAFIPRNDQAVWNPELHEWEHPQVLLPVANGRGLILVPKSLVRAKVDGDSYFRDYLMNFIAERELENPNSEFVRILKNKELRPIRGLIRERFGSKELATKILTNDEVMYAKYRTAVAAGDPRGSHAESVLAAVGAGAPDLDALLADVIALPPGNEAFGAYELAIDRLWGAMFSTVLQFPKPQQQQDQGRKRVDMLWTNAATSGFFGWVKGVCNAHYVLAEYKNYGSEIGNPEFDQLAGRFGPSKGMFGFLICRSIADKERAFARAREIRTDGKGFIIPLDDNDLRDLVEAAKAGSDTVFSFLQNKLLKISQ
ncbi:MAG: hypothetical protein ABSE64_02890 [Vulcanimicrobiaceae bacterium]